LKSGLAASLAPASTTDGAPFHPDDATVVKERISLDKDDRNILRNEITTIDNALTRAWTVTRSYQRDRDSQSRSMSVRCPISIS
jgi:hypothetical protein